MKHFSDLPSATSLPAILLLLAGLLLPVPVPAATAAGNTTDLAWSQFDGQRFEIYFKVRHGSRWGETVQITNDQYNNMHPALAVSGRGEVWLVWTALNGEHNKLFYARKGKGQWSFPREIETGLASGIAPSITIGPGDRPWIAWAGYNGKNDDIYVSRWKGNSWSKPVRIHPANDVPDILPVISMENGRPTVTWQRYDGDRYVYVTSVWTGKRWSAAEAESPGRRKIREKMLQRRKQLRMQLPADVRVVGEPAILSR